MTARAGASRLRPPAAADVRDVPTSGQARPVGEVSWFLCAKANIPADWLPMEGQTFSSSTYPALAAMLGGTTLPNMQDRGPVGVSSGKPLLSTGGAAERTLDMTQIPAHTHDMTHNHTISTRNGGSGANPDYVASGQGLNTIQNGNTAPNAFNGSTGSAGAASPAPVPTQDPYVAMWCCVRAR